MKPVNVGLIIGRFQPLHKGHVYLFRQALKHVDSLVIGIGSTNITNEDNPFPFATRKKMLLSVLREQKLMPFARKIFSLKDQSDEEWMKETIKKAGKVDVVIGNNEWVNGLFEKKGYKILRLSYYKRHLYESTKVRKLIKTGKKWHARVPLPVIAYIEAISSQGKPSLPK